MLGSVSFSERLPAGRLKPPVGIIPGDVRSLPELHQFLAPDLGSLPGINLQALPEWIGAIIGDRELADSVQAIVTAPITYVEDCVKVYKVVGSRLDQARKVIEESQR
jgi:hypothetical protein